MSGELVRYDAACRAVAEAKSIDEARHIVDRAVAMRAYAKQAKNKQLEVDAAEIRFRAERRVGELIVAQRETVGLNRGLAGSAVSGSKQDPVRDDRPTLADAGIDKHLADRARKLAAVPEAEFESTIADWRSGIEQANDRVTTSLLQSGAAHVANNSGENEWYTPLKFIEAAREVMGAIDLDPASCDLANQTVKAETYYTAQDNGLEQEWHGRIWLNPPYAQPLISHFSDAVVSRRKDYDAACILVNNATDTEWLQDMLAIADAACFVKGRVKFIDKKGDATGAPLQGQVVLYMGGEPEKFRESFSRFGWVCKKA